MLQRKYILIAVAAFVLICVAYYLLVLYPRVGKVSVEVFVNPSDAVITLDGARISPGVNYLHTGSHTFKAAREGWTADEVVATISDELSAIALLPQPVSEEAKEQAIREVKTREGLGSIAANARGLDIRTANPILNKLPYSDTAGPFKIDYGFNQDNTKVPYLIISFSTPHGRSRAINWLVDTGADITTTEILFEDFVSPIYKHEDPHEHY